MSDSPLRKALEAAAKKVGETFGEDTRARGTKPGASKKWQKDDYYSKGEGSKSKYGYTRKHKKAMEDAGVL